MNETQASVAGDYKDRRTGLLVVGILQVVLGAGAFLMAVLSAVMVQAMARQGASPGGVISGALMYVMGGLLFVVLGIGTIRGRRWARAIWFVFSIGWLISGVIGTIALIGMMPSMFRAMIPPGAPPPPAPALLIPVVIVGVFSTIFMILVPLGFFLFFRSPHVRATCESMNPAPSWTDPFSAPLLAAVLWMGVLTVTFLWMPIAYQGVFPAFGQYLRGVPGAGLWLLGAVGCAASTYGLFRRAMWGWSLGLLLVVLFGATSIVTYLEVGARELYEAMGMMPMQLDIMERMGLMSTGYLVGTTLLFLLPFLVVLFWGRGSLNRD